MDVVAAELARRCREGGQVADRVAELEGRLAQKGEEVASMQQTMRWVCEHQASYAELTMVLGRM